MAFLIKYQVVQGERENTIYPVFIYQQFPRLALAEMNGVRRNERKVAAL